MILIIDEDVAHLIQLFFQAWIDIGLDTIGLELIETIT